MFGEPYGRYSSTGLDFSRWSPPAGNLQKIFAAPAAHPDGGFFRLMVSQVENLLRGGKKERASITPYQQKCMPK